LDEKQKKGKEQENYHSHTSSKTLEQIVHGIRNERNNTNNQNKQDTATKYCIVLLHLIIAKKKHKRSKKETYKKA
jgi:hypothetical protein